jgi:hypothetical protein
MNFYNGNPAWLDIFNAISASVVALSALFAAIFAARGLSAWRLELVGRRKYELAEEILLAVRQFEEIMRFMRSPISFGSEIAEIKRGEGESEEEHRLRATYAMAHLRYEKKADYFARLRALQFRSGVVLGEKYEAPIEKAVKIVDEVLHAGNMAYIYARNFNNQAKRHTAGQPPLSGVDWVSKLHEAEAIYYGLGDSEDKIAERVRQCVREAQQVFRPILENGP